MVFVQCKAERRERHVDSRDVFEGNDEVEVFVASGLAPEQCVDAPASVDRRVDPATTKDGQKFKDAFGGHRSLSNVGAKPPQRRDSPARRRVMENNATRAGGAAGG